jgi:hypothetical protein
LNSAKKRGLGEIGSPYREQWRHDAAETGREPSDACRIIPKRLWRSRKGSLPRPSGYRRATDVGSKEAAMRRKVSVLVVAAAMMVLGVERVDRAASATTISLLLG